MHAVNTALESNGFGPQLLCSLVNFTDTQGRRLALVYLYKRGTFYPFAPMPHGIMCAMIDSGPQTASIRGTWRGTRVASAYSRLDSCETARWNKLWKLFSQVNPGGPMIRASAAPPSN